jgi:transposase
MKQLELFDHIDDATYCMSLTSAELVNVRNHDERIFAWIKNVRHLIQRHRAILKAEQRKHERELESAMKYR